MQKQVCPPGKELNLMRFLVREKETENGVQKTGGQVIRQKNDFSIVNIFLFYFIKNVCGGYQIKVWAQNGLETGQLGEAGGKKNNG